MFPPLPWGGEVAAAPTVFIKVRWQCVYNQVSASMSSCKALSQFVYNAMSVIMCSCKAVSLSAVGVSILVQVSALGYSVPAQKSKLAVKGTLFPMCRRAQLGP